MSTHLLHVIGLARLVRITVEKILLAFDIRLLKAGKDSACRIHKPEKGKVFAGTTCDPSFKCINSTTKEQIIGILSLRISSMNPTTVEESR